MKTEDKSTEMWLKLLRERWEQTAQKVAKLAKDIPQEKFDWMPLGGVRTCGEVIRHVAFWNQYAADTLRGNAANDTGNELPQTQYPTKALAIRALEKTSHELVSAIEEHGSSLDAKAAESVIASIEHACEHYGQMVVYSRLMGLGS